MTTSCPRMPDDSRGDRPATDMVVESSTHDFDLRKFRHKQHLEDSETLPCGGAPLNS